MWLPTDSTLCRGKFPPALLVCAALLSLCLTACGYHLASDSPSVLGDGSKTLKIKGVDYPTLQPWLPYSIRSSLRDEVGARYLAQWVDSGPADYEIQINVKSYTTREWMRDEVDTVTRLYDASMTLEAIVYDGSTNKEIWRSGLVSYSDRLQNPNEQLAAGELITQIVRQLTDKMRDVF